MPIVRSLKARLELDHSNYTKGIQAAADGTKSLTAVTDSVAKKSSGSITAMTGGIVSAFKRMAGTAAFAIGLVTLGILGIISSIVGLGVAVVRWGMQMWDTLAASTRPFSAFHDQMLELQTAINGLRGAWYALFVNLLAAALPVIIPIIQWLTKMLNVLSMVFAALTGQKMVYQAITLAATQAGNAARGALAGFDQLDVLANNNNMLQFQQVPIDETILKQVNDAKLWLSNLWNTVVSGAQWAWNEVSLIWTNPALFFKHLWDNAVTGAQWAWSMVVLIWGIAAPWLYQNIIIPIKNYLSQMWANAWVGAALAWNFIVSTWMNANSWYESHVTGPIGAYFQTLWENAKLGALIAWTMITNTWSNISNWFQLNVTNPIGNLFHFMVNGIIDSINGMIQAIVSGINTLAMGMNMVGAFAGVNVSYMTAPQIPHLAEGAVIPPNAPFMAVLGDQKSGTNIEAPADTLRQIIQEELSNMKIDFTMNFDGSMSALVREMKPHIDKETVRVGPSLVKNVQVQIS